ncbi:MAG: hypothetical protein KAJ14_05905 [Candidatus Omnitrophica bacterium]|nr:hypothetical protein [Candidatus Omnitrophota bacterium]
MRKDFAIQDKIKLAQRSGYICSYPSCENLTIGPSEEGCSKISSVGMACHIYAASEGLNAKRINPNLTDEKVAHISNGIWMCYTHGKLIDTDDIRFNPEILKEWKSINESIASLRQETGFDYKTAHSNIRLSALIENKIDLPKECNINKLVGEAIHDSCLVIAWGKHVTDTIRDFLIEYLRNAYTHGKSRQASLEITSEDIVLIDDGKNFDPWELYNNPTSQGGSKSIQALLDKFGTNTFLTSIRQDNINKLRISIPKSREYILSSTSCKVEISFKELRKGNVSYNLMETCKELFVLLPEFFTISDIALLREKHPTFQDEKRHLVFIFNNVSDFVQGLLKKEFPNCQTLML